MCEVWKWIAIGTAAPLVGLVFWILVPLKGLVDQLTPLWSPAKVKLRERILRHQRLLLLDAGICFVAVVISLAHCT